MSKKQTVPNTAPKPTETPKAQLADKTKAMTNGAIVYKDGIQPISLK
jgi:hypothetical protein